MIPTVTLPSDGAEYNCTFTRDGVECRKVTKKGLAYIAWQVALVAVELQPESNVTFMRALCPEHVAEVSRLADY